MGWIGLMIVAVFMLTGCPGKPQEKPLPPPARIGVSVANLDADSAKLMQKEMEQNQRKDNVIISWKDARGDAAAQEKHIEEMFKQKVKVLVIDMADPANAGEVVRRAAEQDIRVLALNTLPQDTAVDGYIGVDAFRLGELQGKTAVRLAGGTGGKVLLVEGPPGYEAGQMAEGFANAVAAAGGVSVVRRTLTPDNALQVFRLIEEGVNQFPGQVKVVVVQDVQAAQEGLAVLLRQGKPPFATIGMGAGKEAARAIAAGIHDAEADPRPDLMARYAYQAAVELSKTGRWTYETQINSGNYTIPARLVPGRIIDRQNLYLMEQRWGKEITQGGGGQGQREGQQGSGNQQGGSQGGSGGSGGNSPTPAKVKIKTKDGKTMEIEVKGEIESIQVEEGGQAGAGGSQGDQGGQQGQGGQ